MGIMDKIKGLLKGREQQAKGGIDTASDQLEKRVGSKYASKVDDVSDKAKDAVDKLGTSRPGSDTSPTAGSPTSTVPPTTSATTPPTTKAPPEATPLTTDPSNRPPTTPPV